MAKAYVDCDLLFLCSVRSLTYLSELSPLQNHPECRRRIVDNSARILRVLQERRRWATPGPDRKSRHDCGCLRNVPCPICSSVSFRLIPIKHRGRFGGVDGARFGHRVQTVTKIKSRGLEPTSFFTSCKNMYQFYVFLRGSLRFGKLTR